jgi:hypothetical protein
MVGSGKQKRRQKDEKHNIRIQSNFRHVRDERNKETANDQHNRVRYLEASRQCCNRRNHDHKKKEYQLPVMNVGRFHTRSLFYPVLRRFSFGSYDRSS